ncbi:leucyl aminopeptidase family protein [Streptosporangiaceae bacterium NEAU-GS5]|nr:leucyl aminopeptidase family protein [Streptosporangiaceae bacterium NEAU-GS5]
MPFETTLSVTDAGVEPGELLAVPFGPDLSAEVELPLPVDAVLRHYDAKGEPDEVVEVPVARGDEVGRVLLYGVGDRSVSALRRAGASLASRAKGHVSITVVPPADADLAALAEGALLAAYGFTLGETKTRPVKEIVFAGGDRAAIARGETVARAVGQARDLINTPSSVKTPAWLADQAAATGMVTRVWAGAELEPFGGIRAVGQGSPSDPRLVQLSYEPESYERHVVLVGKGITFDTGGLSLKPTDGMKHMKTDMAGAAAVIAVLAALPAFHVPVRVTGLLPCAENAFSGEAQRPSDVITQYGGRTVEVINTDAEGRLVVADALAYADEQLDPDVMVDVATLTGAAKIALGLRYGALYATDDRLAEDLLAAGESGGDPLWRMPLIDDYLSDLESDIADLTNVDKKMSGAAGSISGALFLREFTGGRPWAHLDIAGTVRGKDGMATGFGVRLLLDWLRALEA